MCGGFLLFFFLKDKPETVITVNISEELPSLMWDFEVYQDVLYTDRHSQQQRTIVNRVEKFLQPRNTTAIVAP